MEVIMRKRKNNKFILFIVLGVVLLLGVGIGVYFIVNNDNKMETVKKEEKKEEKVEKKVSIIDVDLTIK